MAALIAFLLPWQTRWLITTPTINNTPWEFGVVGIFVAEAALLIWLAQEAWNDRAALRIWIRAHCTQKTYLAAGALIVFIILQFIFSESRALTAQFFIQIFLLASFGIIFFLRPNIHRAIAAGFLAAAVLHALLGFVQVASSASFANTWMGIPERHASQQGIAVIVADGVRHLRAYGGQPHPNIFGAFMMVALVVFWWTLKTAPEKQAVWQLSALLTGALVFSFSRTAWAALLFFLIYAWFHRHNISGRQKQMARISAATAALMLIIFFPLISGRVTAQGSLENKSIEERRAGLTEWKTIAKNNWLGGTGAGAYTVAITTESGYTKVPVHNIPLLIIAEFGLIGIVLSGFFFWCIMPKKNLTSLTPLIIFIPAALFDHYLYSLWSGQVLLTFFILYSIKNTETHGGGDENVHRISG